MNMTRALTHLQAMTCPSCNGHGVTRGLFHSFPCWACGEVGYVQQHGHRRLDPLAINVLVRARAAQAAAAAANGCRVNAGSPENWVLNNNFRGD